MEKINITCNDKIKVQSSLDFYLGITSVGDVNSLKELRKNMFRKFMKEYQDINYPLVNLSKQQSPPEEVEIQEDTKSSANNFLQFLQKMKENSAEEEDEFIEYSQEEEDEDDEFVNSTQEEEQEEFIEYLQEEEEFSSEESIEEQDEIPGRTYVDHGIYIEDIIDGTVPINDLYYGDEDNLEEDEQDVEEDYDEEEQELDDYEEVEEASFSDEFEEDEYLEEEAIIEPIKNEISIEDEDVEKEEEVTIETPKNEVSIEDDGLGADVPSDIRTFLKQHPNSDMLYVSKFYPKKEIEKQLKLGRIYKRKGKLFI